MSNEEAIANLVALMTSFHLEIKSLPDDLRCAKCKSVLKNACQMPCECRFCRACIDDVMTRGYQFCPGGSQECGATLLSKAAPDYRANKSILKLTAKCSHAGCLHEYRLADMESHMLACSSKNIGSPFREFGCAPGALSCKGMSGSFLQESRDHSEILIETVANMRRDMDMLKRELLLKDEQGIHIENEMKSIKNENKSMKDVSKSIKDENKSMKDEIKLIKIENKSMKDESKVIKDENNSMKDEIKLIKIENKSMKDESKSIKDENKSMKYEIKSIKRQKEVLYDRVLQLTEKLELDSSMVTVITSDVASNRDEMEPIRDDIRSMGDQFDCMKHQMELMQMAMGLEQLDDWLIEEDVAMTEWGFWGCGGLRDNAKTSGKFGGEGRAHTYQLVIDNSVSKAILGISLRIWAGKSASLLKWPFRGVVTITVAHRDKPESFIRQTRQCEIKRPSDNRYSTSTVFEFPHDALRTAGLDLEHGVRVSSQIVPGAVQ